MAEWIQTIGKIKIPTPLPIGDVNMYLLKGDTLTLIDAGIKTEQAWHSFNLELKQLGYTPNDIEQVVLTHHHSDHVGLLDYFPKVEIYGHEVARKWIKWDEVTREDYFKFYTDLYEQFGIPRNYYEGFKDFQILEKLACHNQEMTGTLSEGMTIPGQPNWKIIETPGHSQSQLSFYNEGEGILIGGDHILANIASNPILEPPIEKGMGRPKPQLQYHDSLEKITKLPIDFVLTGHGHEVKHVHSLIHRRIERFHEFAMRLKGMLINKQMTVFEVCQIIFPKAYKRNLPMTISQTVGYLDYLYSLSEIHVSNLNGLQYYSADNDVISDSH